MWYQKNVVRHTCAFFIDKVMCDRRRSTEICSQKNFYQSLSDQVSVITFSGQSHTSNLLVTVLLRVHKMRSVVLHTHSGTHGNFSVSDRELPNDDDRAAFHNMSYSCHPVLFCHIAFAFLLT